MDVDDAATRIVSVLLALAAVNAVFMVATGLRVASSPGPSTTFRVGFGFAEAWRPASMVLEGTPAFVGAFLATFGAATVLLGALGAWRNLHRPGDGVAWAAAVAGIVLWATLPFSLLAALLLLLGVGSWRDDRTEVLAGMFVVLAVVAGFYAILGTDMLVAGTGPSAARVYRAEVTYFGSYALRLADVSGLGVGTAGFGAGILLAGLAVGAASVFAAWRARAGEAHPVGWPAGAVGLFLAPWGTLPGLAVLALSASDVGSPADRDREVPDEPATTREIPLPQRIEDADMRVEVGRTVQDRYRVVEALGAGGMGRTFLAEDTVLGREVVLKELLPHLRDDPHHLDAFLREAKIVGGLNHPHVVTLHDVLTGGDNTVLVMEHVPGGNLARRLDDPVPLTRAARWLDELLKALATLHDAGIVHRDVKPQNVLLTGDDEVKLADFGVAHMPGGATAVTGSQPGTLPYMAPEQLTGSEADGRADLYAAAALLYRMLTGRTYLDLRDRSVYEAQRAVVEEDPRLPVDDLPDDVNAFLAKGLAKAPSARFGSAEAMRTALPDLSG